MTDIDTAELRRLLAAATPGPWAQGNNWWHAGTLDGTDLCTFCNRGDEPVEVTVLTDEQCRAHGWAAGTKMHRHRSASNSCEREEGDEPDKIPYGLHRVEGETGETIAGNYDYGCGGILRPEDAALIVWLRNHADALLAAADECERAKTLAVAAFVQGAAWARFQITAATAFQSELDEAEVAAMKRYPFVPPYYRVELDDARKRADRAESEARGLREKLGALQEACNAMVKEFRDSRQYRLVSAALYQRIDDVDRAAKEPTP